MIISELSTKELEATIMSANDAYRNSGTTVMSDHSYDEHIEELRKRDPQNSLLLNVEPEQDFGKGRIRHSRPMLSTDKVYDDEGLSKWLARIENAAKEIGIDDSIIVSIQPKLDGMAGRYENGQLVSRGDGSIGNVITDMIDKGLVMFGCNDGELVMRKDYFDEQLSGVFTHPRNTVAGMVSADTIKKEAKQALEDGAVHFVSYESLASVFLPTEAITDQLSVVREKLISECKYPTDGLVLSVIDEKLRSHLGSTSHHHRWQVAAKKKDEEAKTKATGITWQVGRTSRITPVINFETVFVSGANISNVTGHHAGNVLAQGIGKGAIISIQRAGLVVPYLSAVIQSVEATIPEECPECHARTKLDGDYLLCTNNECSGKLKGRFQHFFHTLGTIDLFGASACEKLVRAGIRSIRDIFETDSAEFEAMGFGPGQASNLVEELNKGKTLAVDDFKVLAAMGIEHLGRGDSKKILKVYGLEEVCALTSHQIAEIKGFGRITSESISNDLPSIHEDLKYIIDTFSGIVSSKVEDDGGESPIRGLGIVFTGSMGMPREAMQKQAEQLGANCQSSISSKTDILVTGAKVGESKITKAKKFGTKILTEAEYLKLIES